MIEDEENTCSYISPLKVPCTSVKVKRWNPYDLQNSQRRQMSALQPKSYKKPSTPRGIKTCIEKLEKHCDLIDFEEKLRN
jgi:hypothetical protein